MADVIVEFLSFHLDSSLQFVHRSFLGKFVCILTVECQFDAVPQPLVIDGGAVWVALINLVVQPFSQSVYPFSSISSLYVSEE